MIHFLSSNVCRDGADRMSWARGDRGIGRKYSSVSVVRSPVATGIEAELAAAAAGSRKGKTHVVI